METYYQIVTYVLAAILGLAVGSFLNVVIYRVPRGMNLATPPSHCPSCGYRLRAYDNIPLFSYLFLGGKCRKCKTHISFRYTAVELANTLLWVLSVYLFWDRSIVYAILCALVSSVFLCVFFIDLENGIIPDRFQLMLLALGAAATFIDPDFEWYAHLIGGVVGFLSFFLIARVFEKVCGVTGLGDGDIKLAGVAGLLLGWQRLILALLVATLPAAIVLLVMRLFRIRPNREGKNDPMAALREECEEGEIPEGAFPFAPMLVSGFAVALFFGTAVLRWYLSLLGVVL